MADSTDSSTATASEWGDSFRSLLTTVVDTGAQYALQTVANKQTTALAQQETTQTQATAAAQTATAQAQASTASSEWKKYALIGGGVLAGVVVLALILRRNH